MRCFLLGMIFLLLSIGPLSGQQQQPPPPSPPKQQPPPQQQPPPAPKISVEVNMVTVLATVRDKHGKINSDLTKDDFVLDEDGRPQTIRYFVRETDVPLTLGLLVDTSGSQIRVLDKERTASSSFLDHMLREKDKAFLIHFDHEVELLQDLTSSREKLESALRLLQAPQFGQPNGGNGGGGGGGPRQRGGGGRGFGGAGTLLYDAVYLASNELMKKQQGRKALIVLTDGVDHGSKESLETAIESAQRADTVVYSILFADNEAYGNGGRPNVGWGGMGEHGGGGQRRPSQEERPNGKKILDRLSKETGGRLFEVTKKETVDQIYSHIEEELRNEYSLGYTPDKTDAGPGYRKIHLTVKPKDLIVQARDGYYSER